MKQVVFRASQLDELKRFMETFNTQKIFIVRPSNSYELSGSAKFIDETLRLNSNLCFSDFSPNPQLSDLKKGIALFEKGDYDFIIAIGGGSVMDMAKLISVMAHQNRNLEDIATGKVGLGEQKTPLLAIPTTAGTGAEATAFAVLYIDKIKYSVASKTILPDYVYLSSKFTISADAYLTASSGLDAFSQAIESVWSVNSTAESEKYALEAIELVWNNLENAVNQNDKTAKSSMQEAAFLAGKAINITKTTAPHAFSYAFTSYYNIPHGHAVGLSLPFFFEYNYRLSADNCMDKKGASHVKSRIDKIFNIIGSNIDHITQDLNLFFDSINININIPDLIDDFDYRLVIANVNLERLNNNPRQINKKEIIDFLKK